MLAGQAFPWVAEVTKEMKVADPKRAPIQSKRVYLATTDGRAYYTFSSLLKKLGIRHEDILPFELDSVPSLLLTTRKELPEDYSGRYLLLDSLTGDSDIDSLLLVSSLYPERADSVVIGVDPGGVTGVAVVYKGNVTFRTFADLVSAIGYIRRILGFMAASRTVRLGTGDKRYAQIATALKDVGGVRLELVDESGTSGRGRAFKGGQRDAIAALRIARRRGKTA